MKEWKAAEKEAQKMTRDGKSILYGSPWSGKTPCYRNISCKLGAVVLIERDDHNHVEPPCP